MIPVSKPTLGDEELQALGKTFSTGWVGMGPKTKEFEDRFSQLIGTKHAIGVNSATAALHLALKLCDIEGKEVITTPMTFVSTNHAILFNKGIPVFADIESDTLNIDPEEIKKKITCNTRVLLVVHYGGHACDMDAILKIVKNNNLKLVEDCAHACVSKFRRRYLGSFGDFGCFSFHAAKNLTTGDGGMITTGSSEADVRLRKLRWYGISAGTWERSSNEGYLWKYDVEELGFKYHMNDIMATIGLIQLAKLEKQNSSRRYLAERYSHLLRNLDWLETPIEREHVDSAWYNYVIKVRDPADRDPLMDYLRQWKISTSVHYVPNHFYSMYRPYLKEPLPVAESVWRRLVTIPLYPDLDDEQQDMIVRKIKDFKPKSR